MDFLTQNLKEIISQSLKCDVNTIDENSGLGRHQDWDSLGHVIIIVKLEQIFDIVIKDEQIEKLLTFKDLKEYLINIQQIN